MTDKPTPRQRLTRAGLSAQFADLVLAEHAHQLAEEIRRAEATVARVRAIHVTACQAARARIAPTPFDCPLCQALDETAPAATEATDERSAS